LIFSGSATEEPPNFITTRVPVATTLIPTLSRHCNNRAVGSHRRLEPGGLAGADVVVEDVAPEAAALTSFLATEGAAARQAAPDELDGDPRVDAAFLDAWTPEVAPRVAALRRNGALVTCLADLLLVRAGDRAIAVTGTAGKTTTTSFSVQLLRAAGVDVAAPEPGVSENLWPDASLLGELAVTRPLVFELTSSHLAFCHASPHVAVVTSFWPDHLELHGSLEAYARAKEAIVRDQVASDLLVVPGDGSCERFVAASAAGTVRFSTTEQVERGACLHEGRLVARWEGSEHVLCELERLPLQGRLLTAALAAVAAALAAGAPPDALAEGLATLRTPSHRVVEVARHAGVPVVDASMAATPAKAEAALELYEDGAVVLVAGGEIEGEAGPVHATPEERGLLERACALARLKTRAVVTFGPAAEVLAPLLAGSEHADDLAGALRRAVALASGAAAVVVAPMFPIPATTRSRVPELARRAAESAS